VQADDDTYVIVENLRYFLSSHDPSEPVYFGHHFKTIVRQVSKHKWRMAWCLGKVRKKTVKIHNSYFILKMNVQWTDIVDISIFRSSPRR